MVSSWEVEVVLVGWLVHQAGARFFFIRLGLILPYVGGNGGIVRSVGGGVRDRVGGGVGDRVVGGG
ncbi:MAG TPA: hypothetical protein V6D43_20560 [Candidatus Sericytochromatia bacterium]